MKPMLSHTIEDTAKIKFPVLVSQKLDGIRCLIINGVAVSRNLKPIRNEYIQSMIGKQEYNGLDGELIVGSPLAKDCYRVTNSGVMSKEGEPYFIYHVFDRWDRNTDQFIHRLPATQSGPFIERVYHAWAYCEADLLRIEESFLVRGAEGVMVRKLDGHYKYGRSTVNEGILGKLKRFTDSDFIVVGFEERMRNENEATINELGYTERSDHKENKVGRRDLGALILKTESGDTFACGTGFDDDLRKKIWRNRSQYLGAVAKIKHFNVGVKALPRFPVFLGFREDV